jgi:S-DNA-T family DNA segregation ATPase FtsK/SpoIIIE
MGKNSKGKKGKKNGTSLPFKGEIVGLLLIALAVVTLLSMISASQGNITQTWLNILFVAFGYGTYVVPVGLGALGVWILLRSIGRPPEIEPEKPIGLAVLFLLGVGLLHMLPAPVPPKQLAASGNGGGYLGWAVSQALIWALGRIGAWVFLIAGILAGIVMAAGVSLAEMAAFVRSLPARFRRRGEPPYTINEPRASESASESAPQAVSAPRARPQGTASKPIIIGGEAPATPRPAGPLFPRIISAAQQWRLPNVADILEQNAEVEISQAEIRERVRIIEETLASFGVPTRVIEVNQGPTVTQFGVEPGFVERKDEKGRQQRTKIKVSKISALANDLALALSASPIRIEAPVPGRPIVGIEVPNSQVSLVGLRTVVESEPFRSISSKLKIALGQDVSGQAIAADLGIMPHLLIAGATGSGKSVCINAVIACLLFNNTPDDLRFIMVDPKMVELVPFNGIPHLLSPVVVDLERVVGVLKWATREMDRRYKLFSKASARNLDGYNRMIAPKGEKPLPYIIVVIDELADLMMISPEVVERSICRIAQMARATGIHLVIATQRPSVDVVTGLIKANFPARISFAVTSQVDSRVILDTPGAEKLLGRGDMLYMAPDSSKLQRLQGCFVSDQELTRLVNHWKGMHVVSGPQQPVEIVQQTLWGDMEPIRMGAKEEDAEDDLLQQAIEEVRRANKASVSLLQRRLRIGYSRAARLIDILEEKGIIGSEEGPAHARRVLVGATDEENLSDLSAALDKDLEP